MIRECWSEPIKSLLLKHGITRVDQMPFGFAIAVSKLASVARSETLARSIPAQERLLGNYLPHRWGWKLEGTRRLVRPIPLRGEQGLWDWEPHAGFVWEFVEPPRVETSDESFAKLKKEMDKYPAARDRINASYPPDKDPA
jgi:hypothetical protein